MIQVCDPPRTRQVRRLSTEEFCQLVRGEVSCVYRPRSEVLRMLTVGEAWGTGGVRGAPGAGCILLPMDADVAAAAALRSFLGWGCTAGGYFLTPAAGPDSRAAGTLAPLLAAGGLSGTEPAAGLGAAGRPGAHCHPAGPGLCRAGKPREPAGHGAGTVSRVK